jgi:hypothetical protein
MKFPLFFSFDSKFPRSESHLYIYHISIGISFLGLCSYIFNWKLFFHFTLLFLFQEHNTTVLSSHFHCFAAILIQLQVFFSLFNSSNCAIYFELAKISKFGFVSFSKYGIPSSWLWFVYYCCYWHIIVLVTYFIHQLFYLECFVSLIKLCLDFYPISKFLNYPFFYFLWSKMWNSHCLTFFYFVLKFYYCFI